MRKELYLELPGNRGCISLMGILGVRTYGMETHHDGDVDRTDYVDVIYGIHEKHKELEIVCDDKEQALEVVKAITDKLLELYNE